MRMRMHICAALARALAIELANGFDTRNYAQERRNDTALRQQQSQQIFLATNCDHWPVLHFGKLEHACTQRAKQKHTQTVKS